MTPVEPLLVHEGARLTVFAEDQPEYDRLPAAIRDSDGLVLTEWEPTADELERLMCGGRIRIWLHTFNQPLQPLCVEATEPECGMRES